MDLFDNLRLDWAACSPAERDGLTYVSFSCQYPELRPRLSNSKRLKVFVSCICQIL